jgi:hypothetical protein
LGLSVATITRARRAGGSFHLDVAVWGMVVDSLGHVDGTSCSGLGRAGELGPSLGRIMYAVYAECVNGMPLTPTAHSFYMASMSETNSERVRTRVITPMPKSLLQAIDDYRFAQRHPSRSAAIRRLIELGLAAAKGAGASKPRRKADR